MNRRRALLCLCSIGLTCLSRGAYASPSLSAIPLKQHEGAMREAIVMAQKNPIYPFGSVITDSKTGVILARGVNKTFENPSFHGEIVCINDYVKFNGNRHWPDLILYTTGEPCPMCMSALIWSGIGGVVFGSSIATIQNSGIDAFRFSATEINEGSGFSKTQLMGGILEADCDRLFTYRKKASLRPL